jgi:hypothetical protein
MHWEEDFRGISDECCLLLRREHQVAVALLYMDECGEDVAADAEVGCANVRAFLCAFKRESDAAKVGCAHFVAAWLFMVSPAI